MAGDFGYGYSEWTISGNAVSIPGLFGSFSWLNNDKPYPAFMMAYYINNKGRHDRYVGLMKLVDEAVAGPQHVVCANKKMFNRNMLV